MRKIGWVGEWVAMDQPGNLGFQSRRRVAWESKELLRLLSQLIVTKGFRSGR
jgi:hypothetical protein